MICLLSSQSWRLLDFGIVARVGMHLLSFSTCTEHDIANDALATAPSVLSRRALCSIVQSEVLAHKRAFALPAALKVCDPASTPESRLCRGAQVAKVHSCIRAARDRECRQ